MKRFLKIMFIIIGAFYLSIIGFFDNDVIPISTVRAENKTALKSAPDFKLKDIQGKVIKLSDFKGKVVLVNFWATWCIPCKAEIPNFIEFYSKYQKDGFSIIGISVDEDGLKSVKPYCQKMKINYPILLADDKITNDFGGIYGFPTSFLINQEGQIVKKYWSYQKKEVFESDIVSLLKKQESSQIKSK